MRTNQIMKYTLFTSCYLFWVSQKGVVDSLLADPSVILLAVGTLIFCITFVGCLGALRDLMLMLKMFAWILLIIFILQVVAAVLGFIFSGMFKCCGVHSYKDWSQNIYFDCRDSNPSLEHCAVPFSCCLQDKEVMLNTMCGYGTQNLKGWQAENLVYTEGCLEKIVHWGRSNLLLMAGLAFGLLVLEVVIFLLAVMLIYQIDFIIQKRKSTKRKRRTTQSYPEK
ncbi:hypothetical protein E2320_021846 [Naja naja]|nr:hypothetical protein E2320_021846 [Naja naja]